MYESIAHYYDLTHADLTADLPLILALAAAEAGPVLELGCGSGRVLLPLLHAGHTVTGVDASAAMLALARQRLAAEPAAAAARATLLHADMTTFTSETRFGLALIPYNTFMHLETAQAVRALRQTRRHLGGNGRLFIDLHNPFAVAATPDEPALTLERTFIDPDTNETVLQLAANRLDDAAQTLHVIWVFDASPAAGGPVRRTIATMAYHYRFPHQLELLLTEAGFRLEWMAGDYDRTPFSEESERLLLVARCG